MAKQALDPTYVPTAAELAQLSPAERLLYEAYRDLPLVTRIRIFKRIKKLGTRVAIPHARDWRVRTFQGSWRFALNFMLIPYIDARQLVTNWLYLRARLQANHDARLPAEKRTPFVQTLSPLEKRFVDYYQLEEPLRRYEHAAEDDPGLYRKTAMLAAAQQIAAQGLRVLLYAFVFFNAADTLSITNTQSLAPVGRYAFSKKKDDVEVIIVSTSLAYLKVGTIVYEFSSRSDSPPQGIRVMSLDEFRNKLRLSPDFDGELTRVKLKLSPAEIEAIKDKVDSALQFGVPLPLLRNLPLQRINSLVSGSTGIPMVPGIDRYPTPATYYYKLLKFLGSHRIGHIIHSSEHGGSFSDFEKSIVFKLYETVLGVETAKNAIWLDYLRERALETYGEKQGP